MEDLKECPFCKKEVSVHENKEPPLLRFNMKQSYFVMCNTCNLLFGYDVDYGGIFETEEDAITNWNLRG